MSNSINEDKKRIKQTAKKQDLKITDLKKLLTYYREITETIREPFIILDNNLNVITANLAFYRKFKVHKKDTEGKLIYELGNGQWDVKALRKFLENILPKHGVMSNYEITHEFPDLGLRTMLLNARQIDDKQLILLAIEDITASRELLLDSKKLTKNLTEQRDRLQALSDAKDEFVMLASHQLRTPATAVKQYVGMLMHGYAGDLTKEQLSMLKVAYKNNERQLELIEDLLRVAKVDAGKVYLRKTSYDVVTQIEAVIKSQDILFKGRSQNILFNRPKKQIIVYGDKKLMSIVLGNILDNAGKYSKDGDQIIIELINNNDYTVINIRDNGVGISKKDQKRLFNKFTRIDNPLSTSVKGTGLGLYWVKKILDLHKGNISVESKVNGGSIFTIKTPNKNNKTSKISKKALTPKA